MKNPLTRLGLYALDFVYPSQCFGCGNEGSFLCARCETSLPRLKPPYCQKCAQPVPPGTLCSQCATAPPALDGIRAPFLMEGAIREAVHSLKYRNLRAAAPTLGRLLAQVAEVNPLERRGTGPGSPSQATPPGPGLQPIGFAGQRGGKKHGVAYERGPAYPHKGHPSPGISVAAREDRER